MRIAQIVNGFPPIDNGEVERFTIALSKALQARGHEVTVDGREPGLGHLVYSKRDKVVNGTFVRFVVNHFTPVTPFSLRYYDG
jgi:hypothetical protein